MKKILNLMTIVSLCLISLPALAQTETTGKNDGQLSGKYCPSRSDSLPERISRLERELAKGERVYTPDELKKLDSHLSEAKSLLRAIVKGGGN